MNHSESILRFLIFSSTYSCANCSNNKVTVSSNQIVRVPREKSWNLTWNFPTNCFPSVNPESSDHLKPQQQKKSTPQKKMGWVSVSTLRLFHLETISSVARVFSRPTNSCEKWDFFSVFHCIVMDSLLPLHPIPSPGGKNNRPLAFFQPLTWTHTLPRQGKGKWKLVCHVHWTSPSCLASITRFFFSAEFSREL